MLTWIIGSIVISIFTPHAETASVLYILGYSMGKMLRIYWYIILLAGFVWPIIQRFIFTTKLNP